MRTQVERDEEFLNHKPYTGFTYRENLASFRRSKSRVGHPPEPEGASQTEEAVEEEHELGNTEGEGIEIPHPSDPLVMHHPAATSMLPNLPEQGE